jgi:hypothetical protein
MLFKKLYDKAVDAYVKTLNQIEQSTSGNTDVILEGEVKFDELVEIVRKMPKKEGELTLWTSAFKLEKWYIITKVENEDDEDDYEYTEPQDSVGGKPFIGSIKGKGWFFVFTDLDHATRFALEHNMPTVNGVARTIDMLPYNAVNWMIKYKQRKTGVIGASFNEGVHGWHIPIDNLDIVKVRLVNRRIISKPKKKK